jgi:hypothetical protein
VQKLVIVVANLLAIAALMYLFDGPYRKYRLDLLRFQIFRARDDLFAAAERGVIPFDDPAYGMTRQILNGMIRFAHSVGFWRVVTCVVLRHWLADPEASKRFASSYDLAVQQLPLHAKREVMWAMSQANIALFSYLCHTSLALFPLVFLAKWLLRASIHVKRQTREARKRIPTLAKQMLDHLAYKIGDPDFVTK